MIKKLNIFLLCFVFVVNMKAQDLQVSFYKTDKECALGKAVIAILSGFPPYNYLWSDGAIGDKNENLVPGDYYVTVTDDHNSDTTIYFTIGEDECEPYPENHFTPNDDGFNDTWTIGRIESFPTFELFVYNRWGQQVHHQANIFIPWDGRSLGIPLPDATYYYILFLSRSDKNKFIKGDVTILR